MTLRSTFPDEVDPRARYSIAETCRILGIHRDTLLRYTRLNYIMCGYFRTGDVRPQRFYTGEEIIRFWKSQA